MRRWLRLALALSPFGLTAMTFVWLMTTNPFVAPFVARGTIALNPLSIAQYIGLM